MAKLKGYRHDDVFHRQHGVTDSLWHRMRNGSFLCKAGLDKSKPEAFSVGLLGRLKESEICFACTNTEEKPIKRNSNYFARDRGSWTEEDWSEKDDDLVRCQYAANAKAVRELLPHRGRASIHRRAIFLGVIS